MIRSLSVNNFKSLRNLHLNDLSRITLFGGKNNAGKTSLLESLFMFFDRTNPNIFLRQYNWRGVTGIALHPDALFSPLFNEYNRNRPIEISVRTRSGSNEKMTINYKTDVKRDMGTGTSSHHIFTISNEPVC